MTIKSKSISEKLSSFYDFSYKKITFFKYKNRTKIKKIKNKVDALSSRVILINNKVNYFNEVYFTVFNVSVEGFIFNIKKHERKYPHAFTYGVLVFIFMAGYFGFIHGSNVDINVPPKEMAYVAGAIIAGLVGFLINESNKESEIGKHREKWLSELKEEVADFLSNIETYCIVIDKFLSVYNPGSYVGAEKSKEYYEYAGNLEQAINKEYNKISLFLKTDKDKPERKVYEGVRNTKESVDLVGSMLNEIKNNYSSPSEPRIKKKMRVLYSVTISKTIVLVKSYCDNEWLYIKKGHISFRLKRALILAAVLFIVTAFSGYTISYYDRWV